MRRERDGWGEPWRELCRWGPEVGGGGGGVGSGGQTTSRTERKRPLSQASQSHLSVSAKRRHANADCDSPSNKTCTSWPRVSKASLASGAQFPQGCYASCSPLYSRLGGFQLCPEGRSGSSLGDPHPAPSPFAKGEGMVGWKLVERCRRLRRPRERRRGRACAHSGPRLSPGTALRLWPPMAPDAGGVVLLDLPTAVVDFDRAPAVFDAEAGGGGRMAAWGTLTLHPLPSPRERELWVGDSWNGEGGSGVLEKCGGAGHATTLGRGSTRARFTSAGGGGPRCWWCCTPRPASNCRRLRRRPSRIRCRNGRGRPCRS